MVDEICRFWGPFVWKFVNFYFSLLCEYMLSDLFAIPTIVRSSAKHKLEPHNPKRKIIRSESMILMTNNLRCHIPRCPTRILMVIIPHNPRDPQISDPEITVRVKDKILWFEVSVDYLSFMQVFQPDDNVCNKEFCLGLAEFALAADMVP